MILTREYLDTLSLIALGYESQRGILLQMLLTAANG
jgi:hypothetical protein